MPHTSSRRVAKSRVASSSTSSRYTHSTAPSSVSMSPPNRRYHVKGDTNVAIRLRKGITVNNHTGAFDDHDDEFTDEDSAGIQVESVSEEEYTTDEGRSRSKLERVRRPRRARPQSVPQEPLDVEDDDDYPYPPPQMRAPGPPPGHPSAGWGHIPQPAPNGYAPSMISDPRFQYGFPGGAQSPPGQMVPFGHDPHGAYAQNPFAPNGQNPFTGPPSAADPRAGYFPDYQDPRHQDPHHQDPRDPRQGRRGHRNSMPPGPPSGEMMPFSPMGYYPPYGAPPAMQMQLQTLQPQQMQMAMPQMAVMAPPPPPPPPPQPDPKEEGMLSKLEKLLMGKAEEDEKAAEQARKDAELAKFSRLENLLIAQQEAKIEKERAKKEAAEKAAIEAAEAKKRGDEDKLAKLEQLILAQKDEQLKREAATEAARAAEKAAADAEAARIAEEKRAAAEKAQIMVEAAEKAREEAEKKAAAEAEEIRKAHEKAREEAEKKAAAEAEELKKAHEKALADAKAAEEETKKEHEKAMADAKAAAEELEKAKKAAEEEAAALKPSDAPKAPIKFKDAVGRKFSFPWNLCNTWKGMEELIKQAFLHVDVIGPHVHEGHYDLVGPDGEIILPQVWETMIQPDWAITMHMWPMPEPPPPPPPEPKEAFPPPPPPPPDAQMFMSSHLPLKVQVPPPPGAMPPPPPPPPGADGAMPPPPPAVVVVPSGGGSSGSSSRKKTAPSPFFRWAAGSVPARKDTKKKK
ncbi:TolA, Membrane protein colicin uptake [Pyrenophora tritici-repentis]|nr:TolA, Membrane protein colicin uptake [Pyrenophora tritici-repentis]PZD28801.1 TolA, Membrane protein colicin uptake [Pyrenophora tritici-repentis]